MRWLKTVDQGGIARTTFENFVTSDANFYQESSRKWESRSAYLTFTYTFGQQSRRRNRGDREMDGGEMEDVGIN